MPGYSLRPGALSVRGLFSFLRDLDLDCDINPCAAWIGMLDPERAGDPDGVRRFLREFGLTRALAHLLSVDETEVTVSCVVHETPLDGDPDQLAGPVSEYHNTRPLRLDEAAHVACWPREDGEHVVFVKLNHMVVDLGDAVTVLTGAPRPSAGHPGPPGRRALPRSRGARRQVRGAGAGRPRGGGEGARPGAGPGAQGNSDDLRIPRTVAATAPGNLLRRPPQRGHRHRAQGDRRRPGAAISGLPLGVRAQGRLLRRDQTPGGAR